MKPTSNKPGCLAMRLMEYLGRILSFLSAMIASAAFSMQLVSILPPRGDLVMDLWRTYPSWTADTAAIHFR